MWYERGVTQLLWIFFVNITEETVLKRPGCWTLFSGLVHGSCQISQCGLLFQARKILIGLLSH